MFASSDMFDDEISNGNSSNNDNNTNSNSTYFKTINPSNPSGQSASAAPQNQNSAPIAPISNAELNSLSPTNGALGLSAAEEAYLAPTPAMRKAKMQELKQQQLAKRKKAPLANSGMMRSHEGPKVLASNNTSSFVSSTSGQGNAVNANSSTSPINRPLSPNPSSLNSSNNSSAPPFSRAPSTNQGPNSNNNNNNNNNMNSSPEGVVADSSVAALINERKMEKEKDKNISTVERDLQALGIAPVFDPVKKFSSGVKLDFSDMRNFLTSPLPKGMVVQCYIMRNKKGIKNKMFPSYELYLEEDNKFLLAARKRSQNKTSNYLMSMDKKNMGKESASYLGKVRSNFVGTEFIAFDKGINPKDMDESNAAISMLTVRQEITAVFYESNILGAKGPRKMTAVIPTLRKDGTKTPWRPLNEEQSITNRFKSEPGNAEFYCLTNKTPKWNDQVGAYVLNFNGRVTMASVKNFQLIHADDPETVVLQFGRVAKDQFTMDAQYPLSPLQAFAICLSSFDYKLACE